MIVVRWCAVAFGLAQVLAYYRPYPSGAEPVALSMVALLGVGNAVISGLWRRMANDDSPSSVAGYRALGLSSLALDFVVVLAFVVVYTFDVNTAIWALIYILPLEGAILFQRFGAMATMVVASLCYFGRELYGAHVFGYPFLPVSITFRMGIGFIIAGVAGAISAQLLKERDRVEQLHLTSRSLASSLDESQVLEGLARAACESVGGLFSIIYRSDEMGLRPAASYNAPSRYGHYLADGFVDGGLERAPAVRAVTERRVVWSDDVWTDFKGRDRLGELAAEARRLGFRSVAAAPIDAHDKEWSGVLVVYFGGGHRLSRGELDLLEGVAKAGAVALGNASAYGRQQSTTEELRRLQRLRNQFVAMVAHDLRTPLTVIKGAAELLAKAGERYSPEKQNNLLRAVDNQVTQLSSMVEDLLDLARLEAGSLKITPKPVAVAPAVAEAVDTVSQKNVVHIDIPDDLHVSADRPRFIRIVQNLLSNALRYGAPPVSVSATRHGEQVMLEVADCGNGLDEARLGNPFRAFAHSDDADSVGLGLAIVDGLVKAHGGTVSYYPNKPQGARFVCAFCYRPR
jgi:K+-sensing histidine kinase KdpD